MARDGEKAETETDGVKETSNQEPYVDGLFVTPPPIVGFGENNDRSGLVKK